MRDSYIICYPQLLYTVKFLIQLIKSLQSCEGSRTQVDKFAASDLTGVTTHIRLLSYNPAFCLFDYQGSSVLCITATTPAF